jgi:hypothetical protein
MTLAGGNTTPYENGFWLGLLFSGYKYADLIEMDHQNGNIEF